MKRNTVNATVDGVLALSGTGMLVTGLLLAFILPAGSNKSLELWGLGRHDWGEVHLWLAYAVFGACLVHVVLHWTWIVATVRRAIIGKGGGKPSLRLRVVSACVASVLFVALVAGLWAIATDGVTERGAASGGRAADNEARAIEGGAGAAPERRQRQRAGRAEH